MEPVTDAVAFRSDRTEAKQSQSGVTTITGREHARAQEVITGVREYRGDLWLPLDLLDRYSRCRDLTVGRAVAVLRLGGMDVALNEGVHCVKMPRSDKRADPRSHITHRS